MLPTSLLPCICLMLNKHQDLSSVSCTCNRGQHHCTGFTGLTSQQKAAVRINIMDKLSDAQIQHTTGFKLCLFLINRNILLAISAGAMAQPILINSLNIVLISLQILTLPTAMAEQEICVFDCMGINLISDKLISL